MCFIKKENGRLITSRFYRIWSGKRFMLLHKNRKFDRLLTLDIVHHSGDYSFLIEDSSSDKIEELHNPQNGHYEFEIKQGHSYRIKITSHKSSGSYKIHIKNLANV